MLGPKGATKQAKEILQSFELFFDEQVLKLLIENTNKYIQKVKGNLQRSQDARETTDSGMRDFVGILIR